ncbi:hypothetical protein AUP74_01268 [Microbulbifer aggregans]|uniref:Uncharacterized protein n=1 Tax=Microbulbifer aggregans TaxID=1769779 RepID=A0A1C9W6I4_9GAMM|nr:hypothetical protein AUP74_01268 [Microbulbifer aggregans]
MKADPELQERLLVHDSEHHNVNVKHWWAAMKDDHNLWRLKIWEPDTGELVNYRVVYGYVPSSKWVQARYCILAVVHRGNFNYEPSSEIGQRIYSDYQELI